MAVTLVGAAVLAGGSATCLGLIDAGREVDTTLEQIDYQARQLHQAIRDAVERGEPTDPDDRSRAAVERRVASLREVVVRVLTSHAPPYVRGLAVTLGGSLNLIPPSDAIRQSLSDYLLQADQAPAEAARSSGAAQLQGRLLDMNYEGFSNRISQARERANEGVSRAITALQAIAFLAIGIAAVAVGLSD